MRWSSKIKTHAELKARQRLERDAYPTSLALRVHRALSWLDRAEQCGDDADAGFIFLWVAFNAAYADEFSSKQFTQTGTFKRFIGKLCKLDGDGRLYQLVWSEFTGSIRLLLDNRYVMPQFWEFQNNKITEDEWRKCFDREKANANRALASNDTPKLLAVVFSRLYVLRNQLMHGGATWNGRVNRDQLRDGYRLMSFLVPLVIEMMMDNSNELWGDPSYPVVE